jgi:hypothetical protein
VSQTRWTGTRSTGHSSRLAEGRYENGESSVIELGDAQVVQTNFQLATTRAQLLFALGRP